MNKKIIAIAISFILVFAMLLSACGKKEPDTLETLMKSDSEVLGDIQQQADNSSVTLSVQGNEIIYEYDISGQSDVDEEMLDNEEYIKKYSTALDTGAGIFEDYVRQIEESTGIEGISMVVKYKYKDKEIASRTFTSTASGNAGSEGGSETGEEGEGEEAAEGEG